MHKHAWNLTVPAFFVVLAIVYLIDIWDISGVERYYPLSLAIIIGVLAAVSMWRDRLPTAAASLSSTESSQMKHPPSGLDRETPAGGQAKHALRHPAVLTLSLMGLVAATIYLMTWLGFFIPSVIMVSASAALLGLRVWWKIALYAIAVVGLSYFLFVEILNVPFPLGPWG